MENNWDELLTRIEGFSNEEINEMNKRFGEIVEKSQIEIKLTDEKNMGNYEIEQKKEKYSSEEKSEKYFYKNINKMSAEENAYYVPIIGAAA